ncbi:MAG: response regulator [Flavobacteriales bacterium]
MKIGIADDHPLYRKGLIDFLKSSLNPSVLFEVDRLNLVLKNVSVHKPDVLLLDLSMPGDPSVFKIIERLKKDFTLMKIVVLTLKEDGETVRKCFQSGVDSFVCKSSSSKEIVKAITTVTNGKKYICSKITSDVVSTFSDYFEERAGEMKLTEVEKTLITLVCEEKTNKEIADELQLSSKSIEFKKRLLFKKIGCKTTVGLVKYAVTNNLLKANLS